MKSTNLQLHRIFDDHQSGLRLMVTLILGSFISVFLTWFMYTLIQFSQQKIDETARVHILDIVRLKRQESSVKKESRVERPEVESAPPAPAPSAAEGESDVDVIAVSDISMVTDVSVDLGGIGIGVGEGEYLPIVKVAPIYPISAANKGIEGECMVEYTVTATGATKDIFVIDELCTNNLFKKPSIAAAARFKYKPRVMNGEAVEVRNVRNRFIYNMMDKEKDDNK